MRNLLTGMVVLLLASTMGRADVIEYRDHEGVRHFTNIAAEVPEEYRDVAKNVISEEQWRSKAPEPAPPAAVVPPPPPRVVRAAVPEAVYRDGFDAGLAYGRAAAAPAPRPEVVQPQVIINAPVPVPVPDYSWSLPPVQFSAFDGGRTRHITRRMIEQNLAWHDEPYFNYGPPVFVQEPFLRRSYRR